jgi:Group II intron, maturase-specific domain
MRKIKMLTRRGTTSLSLAEVLRTVNPVQRGWAAYFCYGASKKTFSYLGCLVEIDPLDPPQTPTADLETGPAPLQRRGPYP